MKPLISAQQLFEIEQNIKTLAAFLPTAVEEYEVKSKFKRAKFDALIKEGFTEEQAMQIICAGKDDITL